MTQTTLITILACVLAVGGCEMTMDLPDNFVEVEEDRLGRYEVRGVSADGMVLAARWHENAKNGNLAFWAEAVKRELLAQNYTLADSEDVKSSAGLAGVLMTFTANRGGRPFTYMTAVFVKPGLLDDGEVFVSEAGGETSVLTPRKDDMRAALLTIR